MPALVAMRLNPDLESDRTALSHAKERTKGALFAILRKLVGTANAPVGGPIIGRRRRLRSASSQSVR